jgi:uncharacterized protein (DUF433 family)
MPATAYAHIELDEQGIARIAGTRMKVRQIVLEHTAWNLDAEKLREGHPHLSLASVHSALAYYYDHKAEIEAEIAAELARVDAFFASHPPSPALQRLKALKAAKAQDET